MLTYLLKAQFNPYFTASNGTGDSLTLQTPEIILFSSCWRPRTWATAALLEFSK